MKEEYIDMLIQGNHKLTKDQHHAVARTRRKRIRLGKKGDARRERMAKSLGRHYKRKPFLEAL